MPAVSAAAAAAAAAAAPVSAHCLYIVLHLEPVCVLSTSACILLLGAAKLGAAKLGLCQRAAGHLKHPVILMMLHLHVSTGHSVASCAAKS